MRSRAVSIATLVASVALLVASLGAWVGSRDQGLGSDLPRSSGAAPGDAAQSGAAPGGAADSGGGGAGDVEATDPARRIVADVPIVDASRIQRPRPVAPPTRLVIPAVDLSMPIRATGVLEDGQMELPDDPREIGWYRFGAAPGDRRGSTVLGGHVDSVRFGVGPLARLASVEAGDIIRVTGAGGDPVRYRVGEVLRISKAALPTEALFDPDVAHRLVVITCGGRYLPEAGGYEDNIVVIATPVRA